jgi:hypothetical protein
MAGGFYRLYEQFPNDNYGRDLDGGNFIISLNYYPEESLLGWFFRTSFGGIYSGFEWQDDNMEPVSFYQSSDIQISGGPSIRLKLGSLIHIPISLGPVFTFYREETYGSGSQYWHSAEGFYRAYNLGLLADAAIVINPYKWLTIVACGVNVSSDFLRWESGYSDGKFRSINHGNYKFANYHGFKIGFYFGAGLRFDSFGSK